MAGELLLKLSGISKSFPGIMALNDVDLQINSGEVLGLLGENGAGKSTLMKILSGIYMPDSGEIWIDGHEVKLSGPKHAQNLGISIIHQELNLLQHLTVAENIFLHNLPQNYLSLNRKRLYQDTQKLLNDLDFAIDPKEIVGNLTVGMQQMVEIAKALSFNSKVIIMDEPTSAITQQESDKLFKTILSLKQKGIAIIYISHRLEEIFQICDGIVVLRDGQKVGGELIKDVNSEQIVKMLVGRDVKQIYPDIKVGQTDELALEVRNLTRKGAFEDISFKLYKGEILGFSGLMGSGRTEVMEAIFGIEPFQSGEILTNGKPVKIKSTKDAISQEIAIVPEDRRRHGMIGSFTVAENVTLPVLNKISGLFKNISFNKEREITNKYIAQLRIKTPGPDAVISNLSGGNQQKAIIGKWLETKPKILILDEPTRGIDIGAKTEIYQIIQQLAMDGTSIIIVSSELPEVLGISHRILVMSHGKITGEFSHEEATAEKIMMCSTKGAQ